VQIISCVQSRPIMVSSRPAEWHVVDFIEGNRKDP
jgi:hypothetical protein